MPLTAAPQGLAYPTALVAARAVAARHRVGLAQGILMTGRRLTAEEAFALLKRESQNTHVKLRTIAQTVIQTGDLPVGRGE
jgi:AmiR/NasT family two-component response regulator